MRVLHYIDTENFAGTERHILELASAQIKQGIAARIACPANSALAAKAREGGLHVLQINGGGAFNWSAVRILRRLLKAGRADVLHAHNGRSALSCALAVKLARRGRCVATQHFIDPARVSRTGAAAWLFNRVHGWVNGAVDHFVANSDAARVAMLERGDAPPHKITTTPLGISLPDLAGIASAPETRAELGIADGASVVVCVARLEREKDVGTLVEAMLTVARENPDAVCLVAGEGGEKEALLAQIDSLGLGGKVRLLGFRSEIWSLIRAGDVFVLPSIAEPFGLVLLEAMAMGKTVIATGAGGPREIVIEGETGLLVPPQSPVALAEAILALLRNPPWRDQLGQNGLQRFLQNYTTDRMAQSTLQAYDKALTSAVS